MASSFLPLQGNLVPANYSNIFCPTWGVQSTFVTSKKNIKVQRTQHELYLDGEKLEITQLDLIRLSLYGGNIEELKEKHHLSSKDIERIETRDVLIEVDEIEEEYIKFDSLIPVCDFGWEGYHSDSNKADHATTLAKEIALELELVGQPQTFDLYTKNGVKGTFNISYREGIHNNQSMFFIREDLLKIYLEKNDLVLIWAIWGEREYSYDQIEKLFHGPNRPEQPYAVYSLVKRYL